MNRKSSCALLLGCAFFIIFLFATWQGAAVLPVVPPPAASAGPALWKGRTFEVMLQGFLILSGVISILLVLGSERWRERPP